MNVALDQDFHVHSTFSDGASTLAENVEVARERGLANLAIRVARANAMVEVNEKWSCPSARTVAAMADAGVRLMAGSDSHHCRDIGVYDSVRVTASALARA